MHILLYGATGFTGTLTARALAAAGVPFIISGRDSHRLRRLAATLPGDVGVRPAHVHDASALLAATEGAAVVINCAGPFAHIGEPVVRAALSSGADYIDSSGEQAFMRDIYERFDSAARRASLRISPGCAFEVALGDWAATAAASALPGDGPIDELSIAYALDNFRASAGTRTSAVDSLSRTGVIWDRDRWIAVAHASETRTISFPELGQRRAISFPSGEIITVPRHISTHRVRTYVSMSGDSGIGRLATRLASFAEPAQPLIARALPLLARSPLLTYVRAHTAGSAPPTDAERKRSRFTILARATRKFEERRIAIAGRDPYGLTASILCYCARALMANRGDDGGDRYFGVLAPSQLTNATASLDAMKAFGCRVLE